MFECAMCMTWTVNIAQHFTTECPYRLVTCTICTRHMMKKDEREHMLHHAHAVNARLAEVTTQQESLRAERVVLERYLHTCDLVLNEPEELL